MHDAPADHFDVSALLLKQPSQHRWAKSSWRFLGIVPGLTDAEITAAQQQGEVITLTSLRLQLYRQFCESYYVNLTAEKTKVYLVCRDDGDNLSPVLLTVDFDEAASYMEAGEKVFDAPLPDVLCVWLERFVLVHYQPEQPKKRRRKRWTEQNSEAGNAEKT
ncbi:MAG: DUF3305 domain-containing protein [Methylophaga sp.]